VRELALVHELAKVLVRGDQKRAQFVRAVEHVFVALLWSELGDVEDVVSVFPKASDDLPIDALVRDDHAASSSDDG
jgi:hypothetical protein